MSLTPGDKARRLANRRFNERIKLIVTSLNAIALAILGAAFILPGVANVANLLSIEPWVLLFIALGIHVGAQALLGRLKSED